MGLAIITNTPAETAVANAFAAFFNAPSVEAFCTLTAATRPLIAAVPAPPVVPDAAAWRPVTASNAFDTPFEEIRVVTDKMLRLEKLKQICGAVGYAFGEMIFGDALLLTGLEQLPELVNGEITGEGKSVLTFAFDSTSSPRRSPDFPAAFVTAAERIVDGSPVRKTDQKGQGTKGTKAVQGIGPGQCTVQFFVR